MPKSNTTTKKSAAVPSKREHPETCSAFPDDDDDMQGSQQSSGSGSSPTKCAKKRSGQGYMGEQQQDFSMEMQKMLDGFGVDITKTLLAKRKRLEQYTQSSLKSTNRKVDDIWKTQHGERQKLCDEFQRQVSATFQQWEADLEKSKEQEEKLQNILRQQQKLFQQTRIVQAQRLRSIKQLHEQFIKGTEDLEKSHGEQQGGVVQSELKKEMAMLQKKILMDTQQQEITSMKKSLQTMLF